MLTSLRFLTINLAVSPDMANTAQNLFAQGESIGQASATLYKQYNPNINDLAVVLTAYWADSLGVGTSTINTNLLATALYTGSNTQWPQSLCSSAATSAVSVWHGILVRKSLSDVGNVPYPGTDVTASPDIICNGNQMATSQQIAQWTSAAGWQQAPWVQPGNQANYIYIRGMNMSPDPLGARVTLYAFRSSLGMASPSQWQQIQTMAGNTFSVAEPVPVNGIAITSSDPFLFNPGSSGAEHMCLVALASTPYLRNPLPSDGNFNMSQWLSWDLAAGWHNMDVVSSSAVKLGIANHNATPELFRIEAVCHNLPANTVVHLTSADAGVTIDSGAVHISGNGVVSTVAQLPAKHDGTLKVHVGVPNGGKLPKGAVVELRYHWLVNSGHPEFAPAAAAVALGRNALDTDGNAAMYMGNFILVGGA